MYSPLEQFSVTKLVCISEFFNLYLSNSNLQLLLVIAAFFFFKNIYTFIPKRYDYIYEKVVIFVKNMVESNIGSYYLYYFIFLFTLFILLALANLSGMVPYTFTVTSHLIFTFCLSFMCFFAVNLIGILKHGFAFLGLFFPAGAPKALAPLLIFVIFDNDFCIGENFCLLII